MEETGVRLDAVWDELRYAYGNGLIYRPEDTTLRRIACDGGGYYPEESSGGPTGPSRHEPDPGDPSNWCYECGDKAIAHCGCCGMPLCSRHMETQAGFCSDRVTIDTQVGAVPACIRPGLDDEDYDIAVDAPAFNSGLPDDEQLSPEQLRDALPDQLIGRAQAAIGDALDAVKSNEADATQIEPLREIE